MLIGPAAEAIPSPPPSPGVPSPGVPIGPAPVSGPCVPAAPGYAPVPLPSWLRKPNAISRSIPRRSSRPANRPRNPGSRGAAVRSSTCSTTSTAAVRPKRAGSARGSGSELTIVRVASPSVSRPPEAFDSTSVGVSSPSSCASSSTVTSTAVDDSPVSNVSVPLAAA